VESDHSPPKSNGQWKNTPSTAGIHYFCRHWAAFIGSGALYHNAPDHTRLCWCPMEFAVCWPSPSSAGKPHCWLAKFVVHYCEPRWWCVIMNNNSHNTKKTQEDLMTLYILHILCRWRGTTNCVYNRSSHCKKSQKFRSSKGVLPSMAGKLCFADSGTATLSMSSFQEDLGFCSNDQLEPGESMFKIWGVPTYTGSTWNWIITSSHWHALQPQNHKPLITEVNVRHPL